MDAIFKSGGNQEDIIKASKKGQPLMVFVSVAGDPTMKETQEISGIWQTSLQNNNIQVQRYNAWYYRNIFSCIHLVDYCHQT